MYAGKKRIVFIVAALLGAAGWVPGLPAGWSGSVARAADLPTQVRTSPNVTANQPQIAQFVKKCVADLMQTSSDRRRDGRDSLTRQVESINGIPVDPVFQEIYCGIAATELQAALKSADPAVRVNAGLVVSRLLNATRSGRLKPLVTQLLSDESPAVALYGLRSAEMIMGDILNGPNPDKDPVIPAIVASVKKHHSQGMIARDAYRVIAMGAPNAAVPKLPPAGLKTLIDTMTQVLGERVSIYATDNPSEPLSETHPAVLLGSSSVVAAMDANQKQAVIQHLSDLLVVASARTQVSNPVQKGDLHYMIVRAAQGLGQVVGSVPNMTPVVGQLSTISKTTLNNVGTLSDLSTGVHALIRQQPGMDKLKAAPEVKPVAEKPADESASN